jgi:hypothetical protein
MSKRGNVGLLSCCQWIGMYYVAKKARTAYNKER